MSSYLSKRTGDPPLENTLKYSWLLSIYLSVSICLSLNLPTYLSACLFLYLLFSLHVHLSNYLSIHPSSCHSVYSSIYMLTYASTCLSIYLPVLSPPPHLSLSPLTSETDDATLNPKLLTSSPSPEIPFTTSGRKRGVLFGEMRRDLIVIAT